LGSEDDGLKRRGADFIYGGTDSGIGHASAEGALAGWVLTETVGYVSVSDMEMFERQAGVLCGKDISEEHFVHFF